MNIASEQILYRAFHGTQEDTDSWKEKLAGTLALHAAHLPAKMAGIVKRWPWDRDGRDERGKAVKLDWVTSQLHVALSDPNIGDELIILHRERRDTVHK